MALGHLKCIRIHVQGTNAIWRHLLSQSMSFKYVIYNKNMCICVFT